MNGNDRGTTSSRPHGLLKALIVLRGHLVSSPVSPLHRTSSRPPSCPSLDVSTTALRSRFPRFPIQHTVNPSSHPPDGLERRSIRRFTLDGNCLPLADPDMAFHARVYPPFGLGDIMFVSRSLKRQSFAS